MALSQPQRLRWEWLCSDVQPGARMGKTVSRNDRIHHPDAVRLRREQSGQRRLRAGDAEAKWIRTYPTEVSGLWKELPTEVVEEVSARADLVFPRGFGLLRGDILSATEYGVLSYHHGDPRKYRGGPAGFWEFMNDEETAGMMVQALSSDLDAGRVYAYDEIDIQEYQSWEEIRWALYLRSIRLLAEAVTTVQDETKEPMVIDELGPVYHPPSAVDLSKFCFKRLRESAVAPSPSEG